MGKNKILIIDDEEDYGMIMKTYFQSRNYEVKLAFKLHDGLENLNTYQPDILFLDNNLPDGQGWECVEEIVENFPHLKIFLVSAYRQKSDFNSSSPNITVWEKPISFATLNEVFV